MVDAMPTRLFQQWLAFSREEPFGFGIQNHLFANVAMWIAAGAGAKDARLENFLLRFRNSAKQSTSEIMAVVRSMACVVAPKDEDDGRTSSS